MKDTGTISNAEVRERMKDYTMSCRIPYYQIGIDSGLTERRSIYLVSRFLRGQNMNADTLNMFDNYLSERGY